jgi:S-formylglutathione hydrolase
MPVKVFVVWLSSINLVTIIYLNNQHVDKQLMTITTKSEQKSFNGIQGVYSHPSEATQSEMTFSVYVPEQAKHKKCPVIYFLSGLTCTHENVTTKGGFQKTASELGVIIVCPDTSPRHSDHPLEHDDYDFGSGAGFYLNAQQLPWSKNYKMETYICQELPQLINDNLATDPTRCALMGHSMGGHGALTLGLNHPQIFQSISAFAPIVAPMQCPWGKKAFSHYLGDSQTLWQRYDACELIKQGKKSAHKILIDQGGDDDFLSEQLKPELFVNACYQAQQPVEYRLQSGYDHSYYFISTFISEHIAFHVNNFDANQG